MSNELPYQTPISNFDIMAMMGDLKDFGGVRMRDEMENTEHNKSYIINLDSSDRPGTHWVGLHRNKVGESFYFDSFGLPPPEEVRQKCRRLFYSNNRIQMDISEMCGYYAIAFLKQMMGGKTFYDWIYQFDNPPTPYNERLIIKLSVSR